MGVGQKLYPDTYKRQKPIAPACIFREAQGLMIFDFLRPDCSQKIREPQRRVTGFDRLFLREKQRGVTGKPAGNRTCGELTDQAKALMPMNSDQDWISYK